MSNITSIQPARRKKERLNIFLDGSFAFALDAELAIEAGLHINQELSPEQVEELKNGDALRRCLSAAYCYLSYRPRSEGEMRQRLRRRGFDNSQVEKVIAMLKEQDLISDVAFARFWKDDRMSFKPRSKRLIKKELESKKVSPDIIEEEIKDVDDEANAYRIGCGRMPFLANLDYPTFRRRLANYLAYRGFDYGIIYDTIARLWREKESGSFHSPGDVRNSS